MPPRTAPGQRGGPSGRGRGRGGPPDGGARGGTPGARGRGGPPRGRGGGSGGGGGGGGVPSTAASTAPAGHVVATGIKRPGLGTLGRPIRLQVNCYPVTANNIKVFQYDVIDPDRLPRRVNLEIFREVQTDFPDIFTRAVGYDGQKIAYSPIELPLGGDSRTFEVSLAPKNGGTTAAAGGRPPRIYKLRLTHAATINTDVLHRYCQGQQSWDTAVATALAAYNTVIRVEPNMRFPFNVRSFFTPEGSRKIGAGIELWRGFFQSIRPGPNRLFLNLDIASCMMYREGSLIQLCLDFFERLPDQNRPPPPNAVSLLSPQGRIPERERQRLSRFLANLKVTVRATTGEKKRAIRRLSDRGANQITFEYQGQNITVAHYFQQLGHPLQYPNLFCVELGSSGALVPLELCQVPRGQIMRKQMPSDKTTDMVRFSTQRPNERFASIANGAQLLQYGQSQYIREFEMDINTTGGPLALIGRILPTPTLQYGAESKDPNITPRDGKWNLADKKLITPVTIKHWLIVSYDRRRFDNRSSQEMTTNLIRGFRSTGIVMEDTQPMVIDENAQGNIVQQLRNAGTKSMASKKEKVPPQLIVVVLPDQNNSEIYSAVKYFGDISQGVATQCLKAGKCVGANIQYWANVALKVNVKLGGVNNIINTAASGRGASLLGDPANPAIVMGADVQHPAPGAEGRPSFTAIVGSVDINAAKYIARSSLQVGRQEIIDRDDFKTMVKEILQMHIGYRQNLEKARNPVPKRLFFYRDGVSEGQFEHVLNNELPVIKEACEELKIRPAITLLVVIKRHHIRMNPLENADRTGNCPAGTILDTGITSPVEFDWYLLSHGGLLGTSRPALYAVLYDDNHLGADALQSLSYTLCHVYARATRSVSIPAPVYYADIVCARGKHHFEPGHSIALSETGTQTASVEAYKAAYRPIHANQQRLMFFS